MSKAPSLRRAVEADFEACTQHVDSLRVLKETNVQAYREAVRDLKLVANGLAAKTSEGIGPEMADSVLRELEEFGHLKAEDLAADLEDPNADEFMGDAEMFVSQEEAVQSGQIPRDMF